MLLPGFEGPKEQWRAELEHANKFGLFIFLDQMMAHLDALVGGMDRESLLKNARDAIKYGKWDASHAAFERIMADPEKAYEETLRRSRAARKAARRRKRERK